MQRLHIGLLTVILGAIAAHPTLAQSITPGIDGTGTLINQTGNTYTITGGTTINASLFHSFQKFGLSPGEVATFLSNPSILNILARVNGGETSVINGLVQVTGGNSNLFLLNPAGVIFGANASLNVPAAFVADPLIPLAPSDVLRAFRLPQFSLSSSLSFSPLQGAVSNTLIFSQRTIEPSFGITEQLTPSALLGRSPIQFNQLDSLLKFEIPIANLSSIALLPQQLTGGTGSNATTIVNRNGTIQLVGSGIASVNVEPISLSYPQGVATRNSNNASNNPSNNPARPLSASPPPPLLTNANCLDAGVSDTEATLTQTYANYFGFKSSNATPVNACLVLDSIQTTTGIKNALLYGTFVPASLNTDPEQAQLELVIVANSQPPIRKRIAAATRQTIRQLATQFRNEISDPSKVGTTSYRRSAQRLYQLLIAPIEAELSAQSIQHITLILEPELSNLPLAALYDRKTEQFLIQKYSLSLMPSLSLTDTRYRNIRKMQVLAMGRSTFTDPRQPPLPAVPVELALITQTLWSGKAFLNEQFTLDTLKQQRQRSFGILHLATHGEFKSGESQPIGKENIRLAASLQTPNTSYIQLWDTQLRLNQLRDLKLDDPPVELLVLSACRTAVGDRTTTLGFAGLALQSGVKSVLASLWYVSDTGTLGLITEFYQQLAKSPTKAEALRQAQIAMLRQQVKIQKGELSWTGGRKRLPPNLPKSVDLSHPYYWSGFTLIGNPW
ncbi:CHAT domain-containing protein [Phormidesmis priestleyi]